MPEEDMIFEEQIEQETAPEEVENYEEQTEQADRHAQPPTQPKRCQ